MKKNLLKILCVVFLSVAMTVFFACNDDAENTPDSQPKPPTEEEIRTANMSAKDGIEYGEDVEIEYDSQITGAKKHAMVTLPVGYTEEKSYPVLYLLHGMACDHHAWLDDCNAKYIVQNLALEGKAEEMILVSVNSIVNETEIAPSFTDDSYAPMFDKTADEIFTSLMPYINEHYSTLTGKQNTAIAGFSMGGRETLLTAFAHQDAFDYVGAFSSAGFDKKVISFNNAIPDFKYDEGQSFKVLMLAIGNMDTMTGGVTPGIKIKFDDNGIEYQSKTYTGGHTYGVWKNALYDFAVQLFK